MCVDYIDDMTLDESHVIFSGHDIQAPPNDFIWYGIYDRTNIAGTLSNTFIFPASEKPNGSVICTNITGTDKFALSYTYLDNVQNTWYTRMRVIDKASGANIYSQQFLKDNKYDPLRMIYLQDLSSLELVQEQEKQSDFVQLYPYSLSSYNASVLFHPGESFYNIDYIGGHHFITKDGSRFYLQDRTMVLPASNVPCPDNKNINVKLIGKLTPIRSYSFNIHNLSSDNYSINLPVYTFGVNIDCFSNE